MLKPRYIFGYDRVKQTLKNLSSQFLKTQRIKEFTRLLKNSKNEITIKESLSLQSRMNWGLTNLLFDLKNSMFYKRKWNIFIKFYQKKAPMYF